MADFPPEVFFADDGAPLPDAKRGFDAVLGNPPYISVHTSTGSAYRTALEKRAGYAEDLYLHFTEHGFDLLRSGGRFGFIVSDTFFTLDTKLRMRELLQGHVLEVLGQCDPFDATVDAAIFVAAKRDKNPKSEHEIFFVQARPRRDPITGKSIDPEPWLEKVPAPSPDLPEHSEVGPIRYHRVPAALYAGAHQRVFFEPRPATLRLFEKYNSAVADLTDKWWDRIKDSRRVAQNSAALIQYRLALTPGDTTLVGLIVEGSQGTATSNNARFLGYLEVTVQAQEILRRRVEWTNAWLGNPKISPVFRTARIAALGLHSSESYIEPADCPRVATIYNGLSGTGQFVPFRKGDPAGNRWLDNEPLYIDWSARAVAWLSTSPDARWQGHDFFFLEGVTWTRGANHVALKGRTLSTCVNDVNAMKLAIRIPRLISGDAFLAILNSDVFSFF